MATAFDAFPRRRRGRAHSDEKAGHAATAGELRDPSEGTDLTALRSFYEHNAQQALAVARALTSDEATAEQTVFAAFVITHESSRGSALNRNTLLALVIAGTERLEHAKPRPNDPSNTGLTLRQREALVLAMCASCTLDDIVAITGVERRLTAVDLRDGLRAVRNIAPERRA